MNWRLEKGKGRRWWNIDEKSEKERGRRMSEMEYRILDIEVC
jgi:hypothetical protein